MRYCVLTAALGAMALFAVPAFAQETPESVVEGELQFAEEEVASGLEGPWELTWGPDDMLWVTERTGKRVTRIDPESGEASVAITIDEVSAPGGQDGLLGLALHPELLEGTGNDYVYVAYTYVDESEDPDPTITDPASPYLHLYTKIVQLTYNEADETLTDPVDLITGMPASNDHNSGRLKVGPDMKLYYTIGDQGNNQLGNVCIPIEAQRLPTQAELESEDYIAYVGKSLRLNLDGTVPEDNPEISGVVSHVYSYGHRNMQGIDFGPDGTLYASEQGPKTDDEINILQPGANFGWPHIAGFKDNMAYEYARWAEASTPCGELTFSDIEIDPSVPREPETAFNQPFVPPIATMFTVPSDYDFTDPVCEGIDFICWPTVAASSIEYYQTRAGGIPDWERVLLVTTLKRGSLYTVPVSTNGHTAEGPITRYFQSENRFRDTAVSPDGLTIYVATDPSGLAEALEGGTTTTMENPGAILAFTYEGDTEGVEEDATGEPRPENEPEPAPADEATPSEDEAPAEDAAPAEEGATEGQSGAAAAAGNPPQFTAEQAVSGKTAYNSNCAVCHGSTLSNGTFGTPLAGQYFEGKWVGQTVGALFDYAHTMPPASPGSLPDETYADIVAYILEVNGMEATGEELPADSEALSEMEIQ
ncbi:glucose/sorbosone family PQQ-dependent dehydrogenase [Devosia nitrariae]|uniref:L-sorbosone dehydrogenase n=1 Tax=Devosia nitrariae TaxID=2071872 RepID=A0ABQ5W6X7_9HYPH|nr:glucose/sorbosone family PQQ-dependent dehydrogenase [Devosia nitrariae]GLQ55541.1 L-sorbosone dehydrogenase [Devosia nitrariae]